MGLMPESPGTRRDSRLRNRKVQNLTRRVLRRSRRVSTEADGHKSRGRPRPCDRRASHTRWRTQPIRAVHEMMVGPKSPESFARPCKQAQPHAQTARSLSTLRVSGRPVQALTPGPFRFLGFLHEPCVRCCGFTRHGCCGNSDADCCGNGGGFKRSRKVRSRWRLLRFSVVIDC